MKYFFATLTFLALLAVSTFTHAKSSPSTVTNDLVQNNGSNLILIQGQSNDLEGWVDIAPIGSAARASSQTGGTDGLVHLPFSATGNTKIIVNMDYVEWVFTSGATTQISTLGGSSGFAVVKDEPQTLLLSNIKQDHLAEVYMADDSTMIPMAGPDNYIINARKLRWARIPNATSVSVVE